MTEIPGEQGPTRLRELEAAPANRKLEFAGPALMTVRLRSKIFSAEHPVSYTTQGSEVDFAQLVHIGNLLDCLYSYGGELNTQDSRYERIGGEIAELVSVDIPPRTRRPQLRRFYLPDVTDAEGHKVENVADIADGIEVLKVHFPREYSKLFDRVALASLTSGHFSIGDNGQARHYEVLKQIKNYAALFCFGKDFTPEQRILAFNAFETHGRSLTNLQDKLASDAIK